jgi:ribosomal protein L29
MKTKDITKAQDAELAKLLLDARKLSTDFRFGIAGSKTRNTKEGKNARREIARILTEMRSRTAKKAN